MRKTLISQVLGLVLILLSYLGIRLLLNSEMSALPFTVAVSTLIFTAIVGAIAFVFSIFD
jgi:hypothetical protein